MKAKPKAKTKSATLAESAPPHRKAGRLPAAGANAKGGPPSSPAAARRAAQLKAGAVPLATPSQGSIRLDLGNLPPPHSSPSSTSSGMG